MNTAITPESAALTERVRQAKRINKLTLGKICQESGMGYLAVQRQISGKYNLDIRVFLAVARMSPNISAEWLLRGNGDILAGGNSGTPQGGIEVRLARIEKIIENK